MPIMVPSIGATRGIFGIFVPGLFLLTNIAGVVYLLPTSDEKPRALISLCLSNPAIGLLIAVAFGYLLGVLLRLFQAGPADRMSAWFIRTFLRTKHTRDGKLRTYLLEGFPYPARIREVCRDYLAPAAETFYDRVWSHSKEASRQAFNFCKVIASAEDEKSAALILAAEDLTRYIAGMLYALLVAILLMGGTFVVCWVSAGEIMPLLLIVGAMYFIACCVILARLRFIRIKEVETIFAACFKNTDAFEKLGYLVEEKTKPINER